MTAQAGIVPQAEEIRFQVPWFERGQAQAGDRSPGKQGGDQVWDVLGRHQVQPPRAQVHPGQYDFLGPAILRQLHILDDLIHWTWTGKHRAPAVVMQNVQALSHPSCALMNARVRWCSPGSGWRAIGSRSKNSCGRPSRSAARFSFCWLGTMRVTPASAAALSGSSVAPAPGDDHLARPQAFCPADGGTRIGSGFSGDGAGVNHRQVCFASRGDDRMPGSPELAGQGFDFRLVQAAANGVEEDFHYYLDINGQFMIWILEGDDLSIFIRIPRTNYGLYHHKIVKTHIHAAFVKRTTHQAGIAA